MRLVLYRLGRACFRRRRLVSLLWVAVVVAVSVAGALLSRPTVDSLAIPDTESQQAIDLLDERFPEAAADGAVARVVFAAPQGRELDRPEYRQAIGRVLGEVRDLPDVADVTDPFQEKAVSPDGRIAYAQVSYSVTRNDLADKDREALLDTAQPGTRAGLTVEFGGEAAQPRPGQGAGELLGLAAAAVVLFVTFGSFVAAGLPLLAAILGVVFSLSMIEVSTRFADLNSDTTALALMLGLAMSIDYAMFVAFRYREELRAGEDPEHAIGTSVTTAGAAVLFAGLTTAIALAGLVVVGIPILTQVGLAAALPVLRLHRVRPEPSVPRSSASIGPPDPTAGAPPTCGTRRSSPRSTRRHSTARRATGPTESPRSACAGCASSSAGPSRSASPPWSCWASWPCPRSICDSDCPTTAPSRRAPPRTRPTTC
ncbi:MMPL family transporter [Streptomyces viridochromogenes]|uniref:MMPL family transporter n=1 Tax=Streptomyces viridochromogenes TaxID=1938 RepID=UPI001AD818CA|nr:MMPL family transporter [Streptomyces viridochromogenes]